MDKKDVPGYLNTGTGSFKTRISKKFLNRKPYQPPDPKTILSYIPGTVLDILIKAGQEVKIGDDLIIVDAMKMQNKIKCSMNGKVKSIAIKKGDKVSKGSLLIEME